MTFNYMKLEIFFYNQIIMPSTQGMLSYFVCQNQLPKFKVPITPKYFLFA